MATRVCSFRAKRALEARIEDRALAERLSKAQLLAKAAELYVNSPPGEVPGGRPRRRAPGPEYEALLFEVLLASRYLYRLLADRYGEGELRAEEEAVKEVVRQEVRAIVAALDRGEGG